MTSACEMTAIVGGCECEALRFELKAPPLFTLACHCLNCQRRSGTAFGMTTIVLRRDMTVTRGDVLAKQTSPRSTNYACMACGTSVYVSSTRFPDTYLMRGGTFDDPGIVTPGAHIWVKRKHPWIVLPADVPQFQENYDIRTLWPRESINRLNAIGNVSPSD
jgi:hypothetical protein